MAVRWYLRYGLSYRDVEELLAERGVDVDHLTIYRWVQRFTPLVIEAARPRAGTVSADRWFVDETYVKVAGVWRYVYRAVDQYGQVIDVFVSKRRNLAAATEFFETMLAGRDHPRRGHYGPGCTVAARGRRPPSRAFFTTPPSTPRMRLSTRLLRTLGLPVGD